GLGVGLTNCLPLRAYKAVATYGEERCMRLLPSGSAQDRLPPLEIVLLWLAVAIALAAVFWSRLDDTFASTDNLLRLVQVRGLLDGSPWFDPHEPRFAPPGG